MAAMKTAITDVWVTTPLAMVVDHVTLERSNRGQRIVAFGPDLGQDKRDESSTIAPDLGQDKRDERSTSTAGEASALLAGETRVRLPRALVVLADADGDVADLPLTFLRTALSTPAQLARLQVLLRRAAIGNYDGGGGSTAEDDGGGEAADVAAKQRRQLADVWLLRAAVAVTMEEAIAVGVVGAAQGLQDDAVAEALRRAEADCAKRVYRKDANLPCLLCPDYPWWHRPASRTRRPLDLTVLAVVAGMRRTIELLGSPAAAAPPPPPLCATLWHTATALRASESARLLPLAHTFYESAVHSATLGLAVDAALILAPAMALLASNVGKTARAAGTWHKEGCRLGARWHQQHPLASERANELGLTDACLSRTPRHLTQNATAVERGGDLLTVPLREVSAWHCCNTDTETKKLGPTGGAVQRLLRAVRQAARAENGGPGAAAALNAPLPACDDPRATLDDVLLTCLAALAAPVAAYVRALLPPGCGVDANGDGHLCLTGEGWAGASTGADAAASWPARRAAAHAAAEAAWQFLPLPGVAPRPPSSARHARPSAKRAWRRAAAAMGVPDASAWGLPQQWRSCHRWAATRRPPAGVTPAEQLAALRQRLALESDATALACLVPLVGASDLPPLALARTRPTRPVGATPVSRLVLQLLLAQPRPSIKRAKRAKVVSDEEEEEDDDEDL